MTKHNFEAETGRVLELLTHSIYSNKEIFLRELISNSADAIDKARIESLTDTKFLGDDTKFEIYIESDKTKSTITISDNGIGMNKEDLQKHLGTIAKSGTKEFLEKLQKAKEDSKHSLIGQFGVGFYSAFMVADKVWVETKKAGEEKSFRWTSDGKTGYEISEISKEKRGTTITLFVDEGNKELLEEWKLKELIKKYSNYVGTPIMMKEYDSRTEEEKKKDVKSEKKSEEDKRKFEQVNETKPLWKKDKKDIKKEDYKALYQSISMDWNEALFSLHTSIEGMISYRSILFSPKDVNMYQNLADPNLEYGPKLYVQNVLILEHAKEILPVWLRFISGVIETNDLPLNISREMLQSNSVTDKIKKSLTKKVISELLKTLKNNREDYEKFWENYGKVVKEGIHYEYDLKEDIASVSLFKSLNENKFISLEEYLEKAPILSQQEVATEVKEENEHKCGCSHQGHNDKKTCCKNGGEKGEKKVKTIYYIIAKSENEAKASPFISQFIEKNIDVLLLTDPIDSFIVQGFTEFKNTKFISITSDDIELEQKTEEEKKKVEEKKKDFKSLTDFIKNTIGDDKIEEVVLNENLGENLGALKTPKNGIDPQLEKMMRAMGQSVPTQKRVFELNPKNKLLDLMKREFESDIKSEKLQDAIKYAYSQAVLLEGGELENIGDFVKLTNKFASGYLD